MEGWVYDVKFLRHGKPIMVMSSQSVNLLTSTGLGLDLVSG